MMQALESTRKALALTGISIAIAACGGGQSNAGGAAEPSGGGDATQASGSSEALPPGAIAVQPQAPKPKTRALESRSITMDFELTLLRGESPAGIQSGSWSLDEERTLEVAEAKDKAITKLNVTYGRREAKPLLGIERTAATAGKSYVVQPGGAITLADGKKPSKPEHSAVLAEYGWVGEPAPLLSLLASAPLKKETELDPNVDAKRAIIGEISGIDPAATRLSLRFDSMRNEGRKTAALTAQGTATLDNGDVKFELDLDGPVLIDVETGFVTSADLKGSVRASGKVKHKKGPLEARGKGNVHLVRKAEF